MTLGEILNQIDEFDDEATIYVAGSPEEASVITPAVVVQEPEDTEEESIAPAGMAYLLEIDQTKDVIQVWREWSGGNKPTTEERCRAVVHYAIRDAYLDPR